MWRFSSFIIYFLVLFLVSAKLFFEPQFNAAIDALKSLKTSAAQTLTIGYSEPFISTSALANDTASRSRLLSIFEPLVRVNPDLQIEPALAISYGAQDDLTWEFRLRPNVKFHNGQPLTIDDVINSLQTGREDSHSGVKDLGATFSQIQKIDDSTFRILTDSPDPLLLQRLSAFLIFPVSSGPEGLIGTGPYALKENKNGIFTLDRFNDYWGKTDAMFDRVVLKTFQSRAEKIKALADGSVDIVANVPPDQASPFSFSKFELKRFPSIEVNFLMFNFDRIFARKTLRQAVQLGLNTDELAKLGQGFATPVSQFVANGIFGYDPSIEAPRLDLDAARELVKKSVGENGTKITLDLPSGLFVFGEAVKAQLKKIGIEVELAYLEPTELSKKIVQRQSAFYFFGWRADLGDASDFLTAVAHSPSGTFGQFNGSNFRNSEVDNLIETSLQTVAPEKRLLKLREAMKKITLDDIIGIPLFSPDILYGVRKGLNWTPRVDGYVLAQEAGM